MTEEPVLNVNKFLELINYESRMLLDLCSELEYSHSPSPWQTLIWWLRLGWTLQWTAAFWYL